MNLRSFFLGFILALIPLILMGCMGPKIPYLIYSVQRHDFEGVDADGSELIIPANYLGLPNDPILPKNPHKISADKLIATTPNGLSIQQKWESDHCN